MRGTFGPARTTSTAVSGRVRAPRNHAERAPRPTGVSRHLDWADGAVAGLAKTTGRSGPLLASASVYGREGLGYLRALTTTHSAGSDTPAGDVHRSRFARVFRSISC